MCYWCYVVFVCEITDKIVHTIPGWQPLDQLIDKSCVISMIQN